MLLCCHAGRQAGRQATCQDEGELVFLEDGVKYPFELCRASERASARQVSGARPAAPASKPHGTQGHAARTTARHGTC